jgi:hypothetical protein
MVGGEFRARERGKCGRMLIFRHRDSSPGRSGEGRVPYQLDYSGIFLNIYSCRRVGLVQGLSRNAKPSSERILAAALRGTLPLPN